MRSFFKWGNLKLEEQAEKILVHLSGKLKDVVRFRTRNWHHLQPQCYLSSLAKALWFFFVFTAPISRLLHQSSWKGEDVFDYWLRLFHTIGLSTECVKEKGNSLYSPNTEVTRMFIKNCPSTWFAMTFRSKTTDDRQVDCFSIIMRLCCQWAELPREECCKCSCCCLTTCTTCWRTGPVEATGHWPWCPVLPS